ncbi:hypothetical protein SCOCK_80160 [Actinacidiphila cocklensis]|uniref:Uncharacterized protein n=1 Tax=Actinacidiphila cocklensis TaxID=887465 RepID=A0A9W4EBT9_9ACTN|nr:hypothetical protein SCOCK_80160 [Actinacidiphila cocklensis]
MAGAERRRTVGSPPGARRPCPPASPRLQPRRRDAAPRIRKKRSPRDIPAQQRPTRPGRRRRGPRRVSEERHSTPCPGPRLVRGRHGDRHPRQRRGHPAARRRRAAARRHGDLGGGRPAAPDPDRRLRPAVGTADARRRPGGGPVPRRAAHGAAHRGRRGGAAGREGHGDAGRAGRGLVALVARHRRRAGHRLRGAVPDDHPSPVRAGRGLRRLADAGGASAGVGRDGGAPGPARTGRRAAAGPAAGLLRPARAWPCRRVPGAGHGLQQPRAPRGPRRCGGADGVDRPGRAGPGGDGPGRAGDGLPGGASGPLRAGRRRPGTAPGGGPVGLRRALAGAGRGADRTGVPGGAALRADVVVLHLPAGRPRHRHQRAGRQDGLAAVRLAGRVPLRAAGGRLGGRGVAVPGARRDAHPARCGAPPGAMSPLRPFRATAGITVRRHGKTVRPALRFRQQGTQPAGCAIQGKRASTTCGARRSPPTG